MVVRNKYFDMEYFEKVVEINAIEVSVYEALTSYIPKWWTVMFEGSSDKQGDSFTIYFGTSIFKTILVEELVPNKKVVWNVTNSLIDIPELTNKKEWIGTTIVWELQSKVGSTELHLAHIGLTPQVECYTICEGGWHQFIASLKAFLETGSGNPFKQ